MLINYTLVGIRAGGVLPSLVMGGVESLYTDSSVFSAARPTTGFTYINIHIYIILFVLISQATA